MSLANDAPAKIAAPERAVIERCLHIINLMAGQAQLKGDIIMFRLTAVETNEGAVPSLFLLP